MMAGASFPLHEVLLRRARLLPYDGDVIVKAGDLVQAKDIIARANCPVEPVVVMVGRALGVPVKDVSRRLRRWAGEPVQQQEVLAEKKGFLGLGRRVCQSPISGTVISGPHSSGEVIVGGPDQLVELRAAVPGRVVGIILGRGAVIETAASHIPGVGGYGGETEGTIRLLVDDPAREITRQLIGAQCSGDIVVGGYIGREALTGAVEAGTAGIVVGGITGEAYQWLLANGPPLTVVITSGGGTLPMAATAFQVLQRRAGMPALACGISRPDAPAEVIIPIPGALRAAPPPQVSIAVGSTVRVVAGCWAGRLGRVTALPALPRRLPSGVTTLLAELALEDGQAAFVARTNLAAVP